MTCARNKARLCALAAMGGLVTVCAFAQAVGPQASIRRVAVLGGSQALELEVSASQPVAPTVLVLHGPDRLVIDFPNGQLTIWANKATLAEVLSEIHRQTGAEIPIPADAGQDQVIANLGPAPARDVLTALLNGSRFNFILVGSDRDATQLKSVILTAPGEGASQPAIEIPATPVEQSDPEPPPPQEEMPPPEQQPPPETVPQPQR